MQEKPGFDSRMNDSYQFIKNNPNLRIYFVTKMKTKPEEQNCQKVTWHKHQIPEFLWPQSGFVEV